MKLHRGIVFKVARSFAAPVSEQDDLAQEIMVAVWKSVPQFHSGSKESSYIYRIALNRAISWQRRERTHTETLTRYEGSLEAGTETPEPHDERLELVYAEIRKLKELNRSLILLHLDGFSYQEIAENLGMSVNNVGVSLNRIKRKLMENLKGK
jgi:RNA polymerase sigma-70 factor (ECF subfamily)